MPLDPQAKLVVLSFTDDKAGELEIDVNGTTYVYNFAQYTSSFGLNEIPTAEVTVAVGMALNGDAAGNLATIHASASKLRRLYKARVYETASGGWDATGKTWPNGRLKVFDGYFEGYGHHTSEDGKVSVIVFLRHWLLQLTFSSAISSISHAGNPWQFSAKALAVATGGTTSQDQYGLVGHIPLSNFMASDITVDLWGAIKKLFSKIANTSTVSVNITAQCLQFSLDNPLKNDVALEALRRIEGPGETTDLAYDYGCPIQIDPALTAAQIAIRDTIASASIRSLANFTIWDKLVGEILPMFGLAIVPMVNRAIVVALNPLYNQKVWRSIPTSDYESGDSTKRFTYPLRGVAVYSMLESPTGVGKEATIANPQLVGGCFIAGSILPGEGVYQFIPAPMWLSNYANVLSGKSNLDNFRNNEVGPSDTGKNQANSSPAPGIGDIRDAYKQYAQFAYISNNLADSGGSYALKHRFDIAPGSIVQVMGRKLNGTDTLATNEYGMVARVSHYLSAEGPAAGTSIMLTNMRSESDYADARFGISKHPLFTSASVFGAGLHGAPLLSEFRSYT